MKQLPLPIQLNQRATLENYIQGKNAAAVSALDDLLDNSLEPQVYLWAPQAYGKSHLLQGLCLQAAAQNLQIIYLPLKTLTQAPPTIFDDLEGVSLVCLDDIDIVVSKPDWAEQLFHLINRLRNSGSKLVMTAQQPPSALQTALKDLESRLSWGPVYQLQSLSDEDLEQFIRQRGEGQGLVIPTEVVRYLIRHTQRDLAKMLKLVEKIDTEALVQQRRVTVPFVSSILSSDA